MRIIKIVGFLEKKNKMKTKIKIQRRILKIFRVFLLISVKGNVNKIQKIIIFWFVQQKFIRIKMENKVLKKKQREFRLKKW
jgi:hypothetical protein